MVLGCNRTPNSFLKNEKGVRKLHLKRQKQTLNFQNVSTFYKVRKIFTKSKVSPIKISCAPEASEGGKVTDRARVIALEVWGGGGFQNGRYGRHLAVGHPKWAARLIGKQIYKYAMAIVR